MDNAKNAIHGQMVAGMAWRVKYRQLDQHGLPTKVRTLIQFLGVHPRNRGGIYPAGVRCKGLCLEVVDAGFLKEEVNHALVGVGEIPSEHIKDRGQNYVSGSVYNAEQCQKDKFLQS